MTRVWDGDWCKHKPIAETLDDAWEDTTHACGAELGDTIAMLNYIYFLEETLSDLNGPHSVDARLMRAFHDANDAAAMRAAGLEKDPTP